VGVAEVVDAVLEAKLVVVAEAVEEVAATLALEAAAQTELDDALPVAALHSSASTSAHGSYVAPGHAAVHLYVDSYASV
jgi:hypothetical protein